MMMKFLQLGYIYSAVTRYRTADFLSRIRTKFKSETNFEIRTLGFSVFKQEVKLQGQERIK